MSEKLTFIEKPMGVKKPCYKNKKHIIIKRTSVKVISSTSPMVKKELEKVEKINIKPIQKVISDGRTFNNVFINVNWDIRKGSNKISQQ